MYTVLPIKFNTNYDESINNLKKVLDEFMVPEFNIILDWLDIKFLPNLNKETPACLKVLLLLSL
jgi:hypothetical protein